LPRGQRETLPNKKKKPKSRQKAIKWAQTVGTKTGGEKTKDGEKRGSTLSQQKRNAEEKKGKKQTIKKGEREDVKG